MSTAPITASLCAAMLALPAPASASGRPTARAPRPAAQPLRTPVVDVSATPGEAEGEESVAVDPADARNVLIGSNQWQPLYASNGQDYIGLGPSGFTRCAVWSSRDRGASFQPGVISDTGLGPVSDPLGAPHVPAEFDDPGNVFSADQNAVFDRHGTAWYDCLNLGVKTGVEQLDVWRSDDGGRTWSGPVAAFSQLADQNRQMDRPWLAIDQTHGPRDGTLYLTYENIFYDPLDPGVYVRSSTDGGQTWGHITRVDTPSHPAMMDARVNVAVGGHGALYVLYDSGSLHTEFNWAPQVQHPSIVLATSTDGGRTFRYQWLARDVPEPTPPDEAEIELTEFIPSIAADPERPGRVAVAWPQMVNGSSRILLRSSIDGGRTWTKALDAADDRPGQCPPSKCPPVSTGGVVYPPGRGNEHDHVEIRYLPDGRLLLVWRDRRYTGGSWLDRWDIFARPFGIGRRGALRPQAALRVTPHSEEPTTSHRGHMPSEYLGAAPTRTGVDVSWDEMRGQFPDDVYRFVPLSALGG